MMLIEYNHDILLIGATMNYVTPVKGHWIKMLRPLGNRPNNNHCTNTVNVAAA